MTIPFIERNDSRRRIGPLTLVGLILVPLVVAGLLIWALWSPSDRLHSVKAAIVNHDEPVTIDGQTVPLGRQLGAGLVSGGDSDDEAMNYDWVVTDASDAASGLKDGTYSAVVTIPENFSEAATSYSGDASEAEQALIDVTTSPNGRLLDDAISQAITTTATNVLGTTLTSTYLDNIYLGFNTLHDQLGDAADGAAQLADGTSELADGTAQAAEGAGELAENSEQLVSGAQGLADGASGIADGASELSAGASGLSDGLGTLVAGLNEMSTKTADLPQQSQDLADGAAGVAAGFGTLSAELNTTLKPLADACAAGDAAMCGTLAVAVQGMLADEDGDGVAAFVQQLSDGADGVATGTAGLAAGLSELSTGIGTAASGAGTIQSGASQLADGASQLSGGANQLSSGAQQYVDGIRTYTGGVTSLSDALAQLSDGTSELDQGTAELSDGLATAVEQIPSYSESDRSSLSEVVADPVSTTGDEEEALDFGSGGLPLYAVIALWVGTFAVYLLLRAVPLRTLGSTRSPLALALRSAAPGLALGAVQGLLVSIVLGIAQGHTLGQWAGTAAVAVLIGAAFAAVNQALIAVLGGTGRFVAMVVAIVALATGIVSTVPGFLDQLFGMLPVSPAKTALESAILGTGGIGATIVGLSVWLLGALAATTVSVALRRTVSARRLAASPA